MGVEQTLTTIIGAIKVFFETVLLFIIVNFIGAPIYGMGLLVGSFLKGTIEETMYTLLIIGIQLVSYIIFNCLLFWVMSKPNNKVERTLKACSMDFTFNKPIYITLFILCGIDLVREMIS